MAFMLRWPEARRACPNLAGGVSPRYRAKTGKAPAGAAEVVKPICDILLEVVSSAASGSHRPYKAYRPYTPALPFLHSPIDNFPEPCHFCFR
jgi:hypothetical protein